MSSRINKTSIRCQVTGEDLAVRPDVFDARAEKYGSVEKMLSTYIGRNAKKLLRQGKSVSEIRRELNVDVDELNLPTPESLSDAITEILKKPAKSSKPSKTKVIAPEDLEDETESAAITINDLDSTPPEVANFMQGGAIPTESVGAI